MRTDSQLDLEMHDRPQSKSHSVDRVSVVIPFFNDESYIADAINSAIRQIGCEVEIIAIDDGSTDNSANIVKEFGNQVRYVRQTNSGPGAARNTGIALANYDWIAFLDADDLWAPEKLMTQLQVANATEADVVYTNTHNFGDLTHVSELRLQPEQMPGGNVFADLLLDNFVTLSGVMIRKQVVQSVGEFRQEYRGTEDWDLWLRVAATGATFRPVTRPLTLYRWHANSLSKNHVVMKQLREATLRQALQMAQGRQTPWITKRAAMAKVYSTSAWFIENEDHFQAFRWHLQALTQTPWNLSLWKTLAKRLLKPVWPKRYCQPHNGAVASTVR